MSTKTPVTAQRVPVFVRVGDGPEFQVGSFVPAGPGEPGGTSLVLASLLHQVAGIMDGKIGERMGGGEK